MFCPHTADTLTSLEDQSGQVREIFRRELLDTMEKICIITGCMVGHRWEDGSKLVSRTRAEGIAEFGGKFCQNRHIP